MHLLVRPLLLASCAVLALPITPGLGQQADGQTIIVTAQKRSQPIADVPFSLDVISGGELDAIRAAGRDVLFLAARSPSLYAEASSGRTFPRFYIRGLGNTDFDLNANQPVSLVQDGVVLENAILKSFPLFDLARVEVLRGPQGTLFGRNTPAGVIKVESARPTRILEGYGRIAYGRFNLVDAEGAVSGPLSDTLAARLSVLVQRQDDFVTNSFTGGGERGFEEFEEFAGRAQLQFSPGEDFDLLLNLHARSLSGGSRLFRANIFAPGSNELVSDFRLRETAQDATQILEVDSIGASATAEWTTAAGLLTSISAFEHVSINARGDVDGGFGAVFAPPSGPGFIPFAAESADNITGHHQLTQEVRLLSEPTGGLTTTLGGFFFHEELEIENLSFDTLDGGALNGRAVQDQTTTAWALFGSATWQAMSQVEVTAGLRLSGETRDFTASRTLGPFGAPPLGPVVRDLSSTNLSGDVSVRYRVSPELSLYARYARGFRAPNVQGRIVFGDAVTVASTETIDSVEAGARSAFWQGRATVNLSGFAYRTSDQQLTAVGGAGNFNQLLNADHVEGYGFELDASWRPAEAFSLTAGLSLNDTRIDSPGLQVGVCGAPCTIIGPRDAVTGNALIDGNSLPQAPRWIASLSARYAVPLADGSALYAQSDWAFRSRIHFFLYDSVEFSSDGLLEGGLRLGYAAPAERFGIAAYVRNITDERSVQGAIDFNNFSGFVNEPRRWGIEVSVIF